MDSNIKTRWLQALRSGEYTQTNGRLKGATGYCCLGVLSDIHLRENNQKWVARDDVNGSCYYGDTSEWAELPKVVRDWAGIEESNPSVRYNNEVTTLATLNDDDELTFAEIADIIEEQL